MVISQLIVDYKLINEIPYLGYIIEDSTGARKLLIKDNSQAQEPSQNIEDYFRRVSTLSRIRNEYLSKYSDNIDEIVYFQPAKLDKLNENIIRKLCNGNKLCINNIDIDEVCKLLSNINSTEVLDENIFMYIKNIVRSCYDIVNYIYNLYPTITDERSVRHIHLINAKIVDSRTIELNSNTCDSFEYSTRYNIKSKILGGTSNNISQSGYMLSTRFGIAYKIRTGISYTESGRTHRTHCNKLIIPHKARIITLNEDDKMYNSIDKLIIHNGALIIENDIFFNTKIKEIEFGDTIKVIESMAFSNCDITELNLPLNLVEIGEEAFANNKKLRTIKFSGECLRVIGTKAFSGCTFLKSVQLPNGLKRINEGAFSGCEFLDKIIIPDSVEVIGANAFSHCSMLTYIHLPKSWHMSNKAPFDLNCALPELTLNIPKHLENELNDLILDYTMSSELPLRKIKIITRD